MNNQTGPYREAETIDEEDIKRITGVLYGGAFPPQSFFFFENAEVAYNSRNGHR